MNPEETEQYKAGVQARLAFEGSSTCPYSMPRAAVSGVNHEGGHSKEIINFHLWMAGYNDAGE